MVKMFQEKMAGDGNDPDDLIVQAFKAYDMDGKIDSKMLQHALMTWGDKMSKAEIDDIFGEFEIDEDYCIKTKEVVGLFVAVKEEEKEEEEGCQVKVWIHSVRTNGCVYLYLTRCHPVPSVANAGWLNNICLMLESAVT